MAGLHAQAVGETDQVTFREIGRNSMTEEKQNMTIQIIRQLSLVKKFTKFHS